MGAALAGIGKAVQKLGWMESDKVPVSQLQTTSRTAASFDRSDSEVILYPFLILFFVIAALLVGCAAVGNRPVRVDHDSRAAPQVSTGRSSPMLFPAASKAVKEDSMPIICSKFLANNRDLPLIVPLEPLKAGGEWMVDVYSHFHGKAVLSVQLIHSGSKHQRSTIEVSSRNTSKLLASIDSLLNIYHPDGEKFGQLLRLEDEYLLREENGREPRFSLAPVHDGALSVTWRPKGGIADGHHRLERLERLLRQGLHKLGGQAQKPPVIASVARSYVSNSDRLEFVSLSGVDDVLVLLCTMGIIAFEYGFDIVQPSQPEVSKRPKAKSTVVLR